MASVGSSAPFPLRPHRLRWSVVLGAVAFVSAYGTLRWLQPMPIDVDEGLTLTGGWQVSQGLVPYRDWFDFVTPGSFYLVGAVMYFFGPSLAAVRIVSVLLALATAAVLDRLVAIFSPRGWHRAVVLAVWLLLQVFFPLINHSQYAQLASIVAAYALLQAWRQPRWRWFAGAGAATGVTMWLLQTRGLALVVAVAVIMLARRQWRWLTVYLVGFSVALLPFLAWPPGMLWQHLVAFPLGNYVRPNFVSPTMLVASLLVILIIAGLALLAAVPPKGFWPLWTIGVFQLFSSWARADFWHLALVFWPVPILFVALDACPWRRPVALWWQRFTRFIFYAGGGLVAAYLFAWSVIYISPSVAFRMYDKNLPGGGPWDGLVARVQQRTQPGEPIFVTPYLPGVYFLSQRPNATRYNILLSEHHPPELFADAIASLERAAPTVVVRQLGSFAVAHGFHRDGGVLDQYLDAHYRVAEELPARIQILVRLPPR